ncbi:hypothetical protein [Terribacillus sp. DMT04]|uniref:hypothetical protein n=1 Tax=Terribacillus sp. DMT04 TaxID=2850441 RepID=UPI001C2C11C5|nr:hypothetical protein [Terribacillus sp. DMT04]QXE01740.1 hypothetical protein KS242_00170 [Terribacillus sp. DMT04]
MNLTNRAQQMREEEDTILLPPTSFSSLSEVTKYYNITEESVLSMLSLIVASKGKLDILLSQEDLWKIQYLLSENGIKEHL